MTDNLYSKGKRGHLAINSFYSDVVEVNKGELDEHVELREEITDEKFRKSSDLRNEYQRVVFNYLTSAFALRQYIQKQNKEWYSKNRPKIFDKRASFLKDLRHFIIHKQTLVPLPMISESQPDGRRKVYSLSNRERLMDYMENEAKYDKSYEFLKEEGGIILINELDKFHTNLHELFLKSYKNESS